MCRPWYRWKRNASWWWVQLAGKTANPNKRHWNKVLKGQKDMYGYKHLFIQGSSCSDTTRARGEEEQGRHSFNCTTSVLGGKSPAWNGHSVWFCSSAPAFLSSSCSPELGAASVCPCVGWLQGREEGGPCFSRGICARGFMEQMGISLQWKSLLKMFPQIGWLLSTKVGQVGGRRVAVRSCQ